MSSLVTSSSNTTLSSLNINSTQPATTTQTTLGWYNPWNITVTNCSDSNWNCSNIDTDYPIYYDPPIVVFTYSYIYYSLIILLLVVLLVSVKLGLQRRNQLLRQQAAARQRRIARQPDNAFISGNSSSFANDDNNSCHMGPKEPDAPPAYDDVMVPYLNAKTQINENAGEGSNTTATTTDNGATLTAPANNIPNAISTITIETDISSASDVNLNNVSGPTNPSTNAETKIDIMSSEKSNDHIV